MKPILKVIKDHDDNDLHRKGAMPDEPEGDATKINDVPEALTVQAVTNASMQRAFAKRGANFCTTGNHILDRLTGGFRPEKTWLFAADTSVGKSTLSVMFADENLKRGKRVLIISSEDPESLYGDRLVVRRTRCNSLRYRDGRLTPEEKRRVVDCVANAEQFPFYIDWSCLPTERLYDVARQVIVEHKIDITIFDYIQSFISEKRHNDERSCLNWMSSIMRKIARSTKTCGIITSQITVDEKKKIPDKHSPKGSRDLSNAAEHVILGFVAPHEIGYMGGTIPIGTRCLNLDKNKDGPSGYKIPLDWDNESACFNAQPDPEQARFDRIVGNEFDNFGEPGERYQ